MDSTTNNTDHAKGFGRYLGEGRALGAIALPLILASLVNMSISITDVVMMGLLSATSLAAGAIVSDYYSIVFYLSAGILAATSPLIAQARGRREYGQIRNIVQQGILVALLLAIPGGLIVYSADVVLRAIGIEKELLVTGAPYAHVMALTCTVMLLVTVMHHFLAAHQKTRVILVVTALSMPLNALGNYIFMFGVYGIAPMGLAGAALSSLTTACFMFAALVYYATRKKGLRRYNLLSGLRKQKHIHVGEIFRVGTPIGVTNLGVMGVFLFSSVAMGLFGAEILAAHTVALRMAGVVFAIPVGFAQAATVRVGFVLGKNSHDDVRHIARTALTIGTVIGALILAGLIIFAEEITRAFIGNPVPPVILDQATLYLVILAIGQPFTYFSSIGAGVLRGFKDTRVPMLYSLASYWGAAFIGGWTMAFVFRYQGTAIWAGLTAGCISYAVLMAFRLYGRNSGRVFGKSCSGRTFPGLLNPRFLIF